MDNSNSIQIFLTPRLCAHGNVFERFHLCFHAKTHANTINEAHQGCNLGRLSLVL